MDLVDWLFNKVIRLYVKLFLILAIFAFILTIFIEDQIMSYVIFIWSSIHLLILLLAFYFHVRLKFFIKDDLNKLVLVISNNTINKKDDPISIISLYPLYIPEGIKTVDSNARVVLAKLKEFPFVHCVARTIYNFSYYRYDWLKIDKLEFDESSNLLMIGDFVLYHNKRSAIGWCIRLLTRCHWEHSAIYSGNGRVVEAVPVGVIESVLGEWLSNKNIDIAILRLEMNEKQQYKFIEFIKSQVGKKYNYIGLFSKFWVIITGKSCDGLMTPLTLFTNLLLLSFVFFYCFNAPELPRIGLLFLVFSSAYMFDCVYHWFAYSSNLNLIFENINEKPRN